VSFDWSQYLVIALPARSEPKQKFLAVSQPERPNASSRDCKNSFDSVVQEAQHSTVRSHFQLTVNHKHLTIKLFNHGLC